MVIVLKKGNSYYSRITLDDNRGFLILKNNILIKKILKKFESEFFYLKRNKKKNKWYVSRVLLFRSLIRYLIKGKKRRVYYKKNINFRSFDIYKNRSVFPIVTYKKNFNDKIFHLSINKDKRDWVNKYIRFFHKYYIYAITFRLNWSNFFLKKLKIRTAGTDYLIKNLYIYKISGDITKYFLDRVKFLCSRLNYNIKKKFIYLYKFKKVYFEIMGNIYKKFKIGLKITIGGKIMVLKKKILLNTKYSVVEKNEIFFRYKGYKKKKSCMLRRQFARTRIIRYGKYFLAKDEKKEKNKEDLSYEDEVRNSFYVYNKLQKKKSLRSYKNADLLFWGIPDSRKINNILKSKQKYLSWFSFIEKKIDNLLLRSNIVNNPYYIRQCILNKMLLINKQVIINCSYSVKKWDFISLNKIWRFLFFKFLDKRLTRSYYKYNRDRTSKWVKNKIKEKLYSDVCKIIDPNTINFEKLYFLYVNREKKKKDKKKKKCDYRQFGSKYFIYLNSPKYMEVNYRLFVIIILRSYLKIQDYNKPFGWVNLKLKRNISSFFNIIYNKNGKKL